VGHMTYTDKQIFTFQGSASTCTISACSASQGTSLKDFSTNYCDIRNLLVGSKGPPPVAPAIDHDFHWGFRR